MNDDLYNGSQSQMSPVSVSPQATPQPGADNSQIIKDASTATFQADVIDPSTSVPVLVDFWAPWCGPCRQLGPALEKIVSEANGKVRLVKINIDENQELAAKMGVKSIPAVFSFSGGQPTDGFMGALPESDLRKFVEKQLAAAPPSAEDDLDAQIEQAMIAASEAMDSDQIDQAINIYSQILQRSPEHPEALIGVTRAFIKAGATEQAQQALDLVPQSEHENEDYLAAKSALALIADASGLDDLAAIEEKIAKNSEDLQAYMDLATLQNAAGNQTAATNALIEIIKRDREWNEDAGRAKLLEFFTAWGLTAPATIAGRKLLSRTLFS